MLGVISYLLLCNRSPPNLATETKYNPNYRSQFPWSGTRSSLAGGSGSGSPLRLQQMSTGATGSEDATRATGPTSEGAHTPCWQVHTGCWQSPQYFPHRPPQRASRVFAQQKAGSSPSKSRMQRPRQMLQCLLWSSFGSQTVSRSLAFMVSR
jgi:hypothetical protein